MDVTDPPDATPDLSLRRTTDVAAVAAAPRRRKTWGAGIVLALVLAAAGVLLYQGLSSATVYFCNADEVGRKAGCDGIGRFRLQGTVDKGSLVDVGGHPSDRALAATRRRTAEVLPNEGRLVPSGRPCVPGLPAHTRS